MPGRTVLKCGLRLLQSDKFSFSDFFFAFTRAAMAQSSLCIGITLTGPALLQNAINSKCSYFFSFDASSESTGESMH